MKSPIKKVEEVFKQTDFLEHNGVTLTNEILEKYSLGRVLKQKIASILLHENAQEINKETINSAYKKHIESSRDTTEEILDMMVEDQESMKEINILQKGKTRIVTHPASKPLLTGTDA